jgi:hypothetical protein
MDLARRFRIADCGLRIDESSHTHTTRFRVPMEFGAWDFGFAEGGHPPVEVGSWL